MKTLLPLLLFIALIFTPAVKADDIYSDPATLEEALATLIPPAPEGAITWQFLAESEVVYDEAKGTIYPRFTDGVKKLDGKTIRIVGFIFPMETTVKHSRAIFAALPPSCPFCLPAGPNYLIDAHFKTPIDMTDDPMQIEGRLELLDATDEFQMFYRVHDAKIIK